MNEFDIIVDKLQLFEKMYQSMRIVDPIRKKVLELNEGNLHEIDIVCHDFWERHMVCENCVSIRAFNENETIFKMECKGNEIYIITAIPVTINEKRLVVEMIKNATKSLYMSSDGKIGAGINILSSIEHMNHEAVMDELTHLHNRRFINERLPTDLLTSTLNNEPLSIIFADLDNFKKINDTYGHPAGDQVLIETAKVFKEYIREGKDWAARYGGEEFLVCLPNTDYDAAKAVAERIRKSIFERDFIFENEHMHMTCSFGVHTVCNEKECMTIDGIIGLADKKLYMAKSAGKNIVK